jgi:hypothetical protein
MASNRGWKVRMDEYGCNVPKAVIDEEGKAVAQFTWTMYQNVDVTVRRDRAHLIAAAPEMRLHLMKLCKAIRNWQNGGGDFIDELLDAEAVVRQSFYALEHPYPVGTTGRS